MGSSVVPGFPNRWVTPSSFSRARKAERPTTWFMDGSGSLHQTVDGDRLDFARGNYINRFMAVNTGRRKNEPRPSQDGARVWEEITTSGRARPSAPLGRPAQRGL